MITPSGTSTKALSCPRSRTSFHEDTRGSMEAVHRCQKNLGVHGGIGEEKFWNAIPWHLPPWLGNRHLIELTSASVVSAAENAAQHLDDLAVVVLFSVFEANVRGTILEQ